MSETPRICPTCLQSRSAAAERDALAAAMPSEGALAFVTERVRIMKTERDALIADNKRLIAEREAMISSVIDAFAGKKS